MANVVREVLNLNTGASLTAFVGGTSHIGVAISGTWVGTITFFYSTDGVNFYPTTLATFPGATSTLSTTVNGNFEASTKNWVALKITTALTSGNVTIVIASSVDSSYQLAFLTAGSAFLNQQVASGAQNQITVAAQAQRSYRARTVSGSFSAAPAAAVLVTISDGGSTTLWAEHVAASAGQWKLNLPADFDTPLVSAGGVVNTPGNSLVITVAAPGGSVVSELNVEVIPA